MRNRKVSQTKQKSDFTPLGTLSTFSFLRALGELFLWHELQGPLKLGIEHMESQRQSFLQWRVCDEEETTSIAHFRKFAGS